MFLTSTMYFEFKRLFNLIFNSFPFLFFHLNLTLNLLFYFILTYLPLFLLFFMIQLPTLSLRLFFILALLNFLHWILNFYWLDLTFIFIFSSVFLYLTILFYLYSNLHCLSPLTYSWTSNFDFQPSILIFKSNLLFYILFQLSTLTLFWRFTLI